VPTGNNIRMPFITHVSSHYFTQFCTFRRVKLISHIFSSNILGLDGTPKTLVELYTRMSDYPYTLKDHVRELVSWYSLQEVHATVDELCKEEYAFLKKLYAPTTMPKNGSGRVSDASGSAPARDVSGSAPARDVSGAAPLALEQQEEPKLRPDTKVRVVKKPTAEATPPASAPAAQQQPLTQHESGLTDPKDLKKWQKEQEEKKKRELDAQGINPASLLTKENLQRWIVEEKKTYAAVAREYVGLPDSMVSSSAKSFGIQSDTTKKRALIAANKSKK